MFLDIMNACSDPALANILSIIKRIFLIIEIIVPILLIIFTIVKFIKIIKKPDDKLKMKSILNGFVATIIIFLIPNILNVIMSIIGFSNDFSSCWNSSSTFNISSKYIESPNKSDKEPIKVYIDPDEYDRGSTGINPNISNNNTSINGSTSGEKMARLAVRISPNADPDQRILCHPWLHWGADRATVGKKMSDYVKIMDATTTKYLGDTSNPNHKITSGNYNNPAYCSCTQGSGAIVRAIADPDLDMSGDVSVYLRANPEKWVAVGVVKPGEKFDDKCKPGDLLVHRKPDNLNERATSSHTMMYVGNEIAKEKFPNTKGNIFQTGYNSRDVDHSWGPQINYMETDSREFTIWRSTGKGEFYYPFIDIEKVLASDMLTGKFW